MEALSGFLRFRCDASVQGSVQDLWVLAGSWQAMGMGTVLRDAGFLRFQSDPEADGSVQELWLLTSGGNQAKKETT